MFRVVFLLFSVTREPDIGGVDPFSDRHYRPSWVHPEVCGSCHHRSCHISHRDILDESYHKICKSPLGNLIYVSNRMLKKKNKVPYNYFFMVIRVPGLSQLCSIFIYIMNLHCTCI